MQLQNKIEQTAKEYMAYKVLLDERTKTVEEKRKTIAQDVLNLSEDETYNKAFDEIGSLELIKIDTNQMKLKLYHYVTLVKDLVEIPKEIQDLVEDYTPTFLFTTTGEIGNKEAYEQYRKQYIEQAKQVNKLMSKLNDNND